MKIETSDVSGREMKLEKDEIDQIVLDLMLSGQYQQNLKVFYSMLAIRIYEMSTDKSEDFGLTMEETIEFFSLWAIVATESLRRRGLAVKEGPKSDYDLDKPKITEKYPLGSKRLFEMYPEVFP